MRFLGLLVLILSIYAAARSNRKSIANDQPSRWWTGPTAKQGRGQQRQQQEQQQQHVLNPHTGMLAPCSTISTHVDFPPSLAFLLE